MGQMWPLGRGGHGTSLRRGKRYRPIDIGFLQRPPAAAAAVCVYTFHFPKHRANDCVEVAVCEREIQMAQKCGG